MQWTDHDEEREQEVLQNNMQSYSASTILFNMINMQLSENNGWDLVTINIQAFIYSCS